MKWLQGHANFALLCLALATPLVLASAIAFMPAPNLQLNFGGESARVSSDRAWTIRPGDCLRLSWEIDEGRRLTIDGAERRGSGESAFCPSVFAAGPVIQWHDAATGALRTQRLDNFHLPDVLVNLASLVSLGACGFAMLLILWRNAAVERRDWRIFLAAVLALALVITFSRFATRAMTIVGALSLIKNLVLTTEWQVFGALLTVGLFASIAALSLWQAIETRCWTDVLALGGCLLFIALLYLPFGFGAVGHWEEWIARAWLEGMPFQPWDSQIAQRPTILISYAAGWLLSPDSFHGMNLVYALILWAKMAFFYAILRQIGSGAFVAFLITLLMAAYPVDKNLMSLRSLNLGLHVLLFLTAVFLALRYRSSPSRLYMALCFLASALCVAAYETGYGLILAAPLLWIRDKRRLNLTLAWYVAPLLKVIYLALIWLSGRGFYRSWSLQGGESDLLESAITVAENMAIVLHETFIRGWAEAISSLSETQWLPWTALSLGLVAIVALALRRAHPDVPLPSQSRLRRWLLIGFAMLPPAVIVLIASEGYSRNGWQIYIFAPFAAALFAFSIVGLLAHRFSRQGVQAAVLLALCLILLLPGTTRLFWKHADFVARADFKAHILEQIVALAPGMSPETRFVIISDLKPEDHQRFHVYEMKSAVPGAALYVIHQGKTSGIGTVCYAPDDCAPFREWGGQLKNTLVFWLDPDFQLRLISQPASLNPAFEAVDYDLSWLHDPDAPLPPRAMSMLGMSR